MLLGLGLLGTRTCASEMAQVDVRLLLGEARAQVRALRVDVFRDGEPGGVAYFERYYDADGAGREMRFETRLDQGAYRLRIEVELAGEAGEAGEAGRLRVIERIIHVEDQARVDIDLAPALATGGAGASSNSIEKIRQEARSGPG